MGEEVRDEGKRETRRGHGHRRPVLRRIVIIALVLMTVFVVLGGLAPSYDPTGYLDEAKNKMGLSKL